MKKSKIFILAVIFVTVMLVPFGVQASGNLAVTTDVFTDQCTVIAQFFGAGSEPVSVEVVPFGTETGDFSDLLYALQTAVYFNQTNSDDSGTASFEFPLKESGKYTVRVHSMNNRSNAIEKDIEVLSFDDASEVWDGLTANPSENLPVLLEILGVHDDVLLSMSEDKDLLSAIEDYDSIGSFTKENADALIVKLKSDCEDLTLLKNILSEIKNAGNVSVVNSIVIVGKNAEVLGITEYMERYNALGNTRIADSAVAGKEFTRSEFKDAFLSGIEAAEKAEKEAANQSKPSNSQSGGGGGGGGSLGATTVIPSAPAVQTPDIQKQHPFTDISNVAWASDAIVSLYNKGIINGKSSDKFAPGDNITREEFVKIAICVMGTEPTNVSTDFIDVDPSSWYAPYVSLAASSGLVGGYSDTVFGVGDFVTRQDVAVILDRMHRLSDVQNVLGFSDSRDISAYAADAVGRLSGAGVINGSDGKFMPKSNCTRAEAACMVYRMMALMEGK